MAGTADAFDRKMAETITAITTRRNLPRNPYLKTRRHHKVPPPPIGYKFAAANIAQLKSQPFYLILEIEVHDSRKSIPR